MYSFNLHVAPLKRFIWLVITFIFLVMLFTSKHILTPTSAAPSEWSDPVGDVTLANADIIAGSVIVSGDFVDFRVQFLDHPFPKTATHHISFCLDIDQNAGTGNVCGSGTLIGADHGFSLFGGLGALETGVFSFNASLSGVNPCSMLFYNFNTKTLRLFIPLSYFEDDSNFDYVIGSVFGGSFGNNESVPDSPAFGVSGHYLTNEVGDSTPFYGHLICGETVYLPIVRK